MKKVLLGLLVVFSFLLLGCNNGRKTEPINNENAKITIVNNSKYNANVYVDSEYLCNTIHPKEQEEMYFNGRIVNVSFGEPFYFKVVLFDKDGYVQKEYEKKNFVLNYGDKWKISIYDDGVQSSKY